MVRALVLVSAVVYAGIGLAAVADPVGLMAPVGVTVLDDRGVVELRAMYGGLELGMAVFLAACLRDEARARVGLLAATLTLGGLGSARALAWWVAQPEGVLMPALMVVELGGAALGALVLQRRPAAGA